ncbi:MAG: hypothetical protein AB1521_00025 [Bacteroidota bacterium]
MKEKLIYAVSFILAFLLVTGAMYYGASSYKNIFAFDFTPVTTENNANKPNMLKASIDPKDIAKLKNELLDSLKSFNDYQAYDTASFHLRDSSIVDSIKILLDEVKKLKAQQTTPITTIVPATKVEPEPAEQTAKTDTAYNKWVKNSVKLYEAMDTKKAAKIILGYSDNTARDILFSMKKKKAAEIIAELKPEIASRIVSVK